MSQHFIRQRRSGLILMLKKATDSDLDYDLVSVQRLISLIAALDFTLFFPKSVSYCFLCR